MSKLVSEYITGLDVQFGYNEYQYDAFNGVGGRQFRLRSSYAINDKFTLSGGLGVESLQQNSGSSVFVGGDFIVDYSFSQDRRLKLRVSYTHDQVFEGRRDKTAGGIRFRQEFNSIDEFWESIKRKPKMKGKTELEN